MRAAVLGAGNSGMAMAAHLAACGEDVALWNRTRANIEHIAEMHAINCGGIVEGEVRIGLVTDSLGEAVDGADMVFVTVPATAHVELARQLASVLGNAVPVLLNPGRTFGALRFADAMVLAGCPYKPLVAEAQTIVYTCRKRDDISVDVFALKRSVALACIDAEGTKVVLEALPDCLRGRFRAAASTLETSLGNVGPILHCAPFLLNAGWTESERSSYEYYYDGITPTIGGFLERLDEERIEVARALGVEVPSTMQWMLEEYQTHGETLFECVRNNASYRGIDAPRSLRHRYLYEDVPYGLVQFEAVGRQLGMDQAKMILLYYMPPAP